MRVVGRRSVGTKVCGDEGAGVGVGEGEGKGEGKSEMMRRRCACILHTERYTPRA